MKEKVGNCYLIREDRKGKRSEVEGGERKALFPIWHLIEKLCKGKRYEGEKPVLLNASGESVSGNEF